MLGLIDSVDTVCVLSVWQCWYRLWELSLFFAGWGAGGGGVLALGWSGKLNFDKTNFFFTHPPPPQIKYGGRCDLCYFSVPEVIANIESRLSSSLRSNFLQQNTINISYQTFKYRWVFLRAVLYFDKPVRRAGQKTNNE